jgi:stage II sporulation protein D
MRRLLLTLLVVPFFAVAGAAASPSAEQATEASPGTTFVVTGHGWGHGVGFSQCGALGYGKHGWNYSQILRHYYKGTQISTTPEIRVRVLIADGRQSLRISSKNAFRVKDGNGKAYPLAAGSVDLRTALKVKVEAGKPARALAGPLTFLPGRSMLTVDSKPYRGQFVIKVTGGRLRAVNSVPLEQYVYGVVPIEIGSSGPAEALKAQAVAARTYALATKRSGGDFDLYPDIRSQSYGGASVEHPETNAAVDATAGKIVTYKGKPITAYYFASSGGRTASIQDIWLGSQPVPYLVSVSDPYDNVCPEHSWGPYVFSGTALARKLGVAGRVVDARTVVNPSKRVKTMQLQLSGRKVAISGPTVRQVMDLRSTWFRVGVLSLSRPSTPAAYGLGVNLIGIARAVGPAVVQQRIPGKSWTRVAAVRPAADGSFSIRVKPKRLLEYRVAAGKAASGAVRVTVAPRVLLETGGPGELVGSLRPAFANARIEIERQGGNRWTAAGTARTDASGRFDAALDLATGTYRARIAPRSGFAAGVSDTVRLTA